MAEEFDYSKPENHVMKRVGISSELRESLFNVPRDQWRENSSFRGEPEFWLQIHQGLLQASATLPEQCRSLLDHSQSEYGQSEFSQIITFGSQLIHHAHQHHHVEDSYFFPLFSRKFPGLTHSMLLLDGDHKVLSEVLASMEHVVRQMHEQTVSGQVTLPDRERLTESMLDVATRLDTLFQRHIADEEEICIPVMLKMQ